MTNLKSITYKNYVKLPSRKEAEEFWWSKETEEFEDEEERKDTEEWFKGWWHLVLTFARKGNKRRDRFIFSDSSPIVRQQVIKTGCSTIADEYFGNLFTLIHRDTGMMHHYLTDMKKMRPKLNKFPLHFEHDEWIVTYTLTEDTKETKNILGFDCFKLTIQEKKEDVKEEKTEITTHELFVTDQLNLPVRIVIPLKKSRYRTLCLGNQNYIY